MSIILRYGPRINYFYVNMVDTNFFLEQLESRGTGFFTGVPDSLLKSFCALLTDSVGERRHVIAVNEGAACALAAGYHLATGGVPLVYMQNSGIGNAVNPLLSLTDGDVYRIPMVLLVGWRGEPGVRDEPQHVKQGKVTCELFETMGIPYVILADNEDGVVRQLDECYEYINKNGTPFALVVRKDTFAPYVSDHIGVVEDEKSNSKSKSLYGDGGYPRNAPPKTDNPETRMLKPCYGGLADGIDYRKSTAKPQDMMTREEAIEEIVKASAPDGVFVSTTGMTSRELYELRDKYGMGHERDFLTVGSMGHASSLALSIALQKPNRPVTCIDGDGAALMHLGAMATIAVQKPANLRHIVLNNRAHDSVGGQPTIAGEIDLSGIARSCGYTNVCTVNTSTELRQALAMNDGLIFIEVNVRKGNRKDLGRPKSTPQENKDAFMNFLSEDK